MLKDYLQLHFIVLILGLTAILGRLISIDVYTLVLLRTGLACVGMACILYFRKQSFLVSLKNFWLLMLMGSVVAVHWLCFFGSARLATISVSLIVFSTTPFFTSIIEPLYYRRKMSLFEVFLGIMVVIGIACIFTFESEYVLGIVVGSFGSFLAAIFTIVNSKLTHRLKAEAINFYEMGAACGFVALLMAASAGAAWFDIPFTSPVGQDWLWILVLAFGCTLYPNLKVLDLLKRFSAFTVNLSINMEPVYGILLALLVFGEKEQMSVGFYVGATIIISTLAIHYIYGKHKKSPAAMQQG